MKNHRWAVRAGILSFFVFVGLLNSNLIAALKIPITLQVGLKALYVSGIQNGDFAGTTYFESETELFLVPKLSGNYAFGGVLGGRFELGFSFLQALGFEAGYCSSNHTYSFMDAESESTKASVSNLFITLQVYFLKKRTVQPYAYLGLGSSRLTVKNGSYSYTEPLRVGDATYGGADYGLGIGATLYLPANFTLCTTAGYHIFIMEDAKGVLGTRYSIQATKGTYPRFSVGLGYSFKVGKS